MNTKYVAVFCLLVFLCPHSAHGKRPGSPDKQLLVGISSVIDGDTLEIHGTRIRIHGIDAPESGQFCLKNNRLIRCGKEAAFKLDGLVRGSTLKCENLGTDRYGRVIAKCYRGGLDVGRWMVENGWAIAYRRYSQDYVDSEETARTQNRGLWGMQFQNPEDYRRHPVHLEKRRKNNE